MGRVEHGDAIEVRAELRLLVDREADDDDDRRTWRQSKPRSFAFVSASRLLLAWSFS